MNHFDDDWIKILITTNLDTISALSKSISQTSQNFPSPHSHQFLHRNFVFEIHHKGICTLRHSFRDEPKKRLRISPVFPMLFPKRERTSLVYTQRDRAGPPLFPLRGASQTLRKPRVGWWWALVPAGARVTPRGVGLCIQDKPFPPPCHACTDHFAGNIMWLETMLKYGVPRAMLAYISCRFPLLEYAPEFIARHLSKPEERWGDLYQGLARSTEIYRDFLRDKDLRCLCSFNLRCMKDLWKDWQ